MKRLRSFTILLGAVILMLPGIPFTASADLVAHYTFDNTVADTTGNHPGTLTGTATYVPGVAGQALQFDGTTNFVTLANPTGINFGNDYSISVWIQTTTAGEGTILSKTVTAGWRYPGKQWLARNGGLYNDANGMGGFQANFTSAYANDGSWHHVVLTYSVLNTPHFIWYMDNESVAQTDSWMSSPDAADQIVLIGARENAYALFPGLMDDLQIYDQSLSANQVQYLYSNPGSAVPPDPSITSPPQSQKAPQGTNVTFTAVASGTGPLSYQWVFNGTSIITNATSATLMLTNVTTSQSGAYTIFVSNSVGSVSKTANLLVYEPAVFSVNVCAGLTIQGAVGWPYQIQDANALGGTNPWQTLTNLALPSSPYIWFDLQSESPSSRFYRTMVTP
jgi:hypothetical protein